MSSSSTSELIKPLDAHNSSLQQVAVIGAGSFGTVIANLLATNSKVLLYIRRREKYEVIKTERSSSGYPLHDNVVPIDDLATLAASCRIIFPMVPSAAFRNMMRELSPHLHPYHILIHGTKGLDSQEVSLRESLHRISRENIRTMSEVIAEESVVVRIGCLAGPNLAAELGQGQPGATVVASDFDEVILAGKKLLRSGLFQVYSSNDLIGVELCGVLKNIIAIAAGMLSGLGYGENARAMLISRGLVEMIYLGQALGGNVKAFIGLAGVGDLIATCTSTRSRNYTVGFRMASGETLDDIIKDMEEVAEGVNTVRIMKKLADHHEISAPITKTLYHILYEDLTPQRALERLMKFPLNTDINFL